ncbi:MAG: ThiF family adenylyltransferase, partial [Bacteroidota bacterium]
DDRMRSILEQFEKVEAIEGEKLTETTFHQRNSKRADYEILKKASVNVFGVGAIGSEIADCMAKAGTGRLTLFDDQILKAHNAVRHLAGLEHIGEPKVNAVAQILYNHNPFVAVWINTLNLYNLDINQHLIDDSISISSVADDNVEGFVNQQLVIANRTTFYVRALRGGKAARIFRVIPGKDACFNCLSLYRKERKEFIEIPEDPTYPTLKNECNNPIRPASASDLKFIASFASRLLIDFLQKDEIEYNHWIWSSEVLANTSIQRPYKIYSQYISPHPDCFYCHHDKHINVSILTEKIAFIQELIRQNPEMETGGVLVGWTDEKGNIFVTDVSGPGPKASQMATKFEKDVIYCQNFLDELYELSLQKKVYVGEWHSHPSSNNKPSGTDIKSLSEIAIQKEYLTDTPIMIIFSNSGEPSCTVHPAGKRYYYTNLEKK